ncbi:MAG: peptidoglycan DD-metalloendopeptidase family protein [Hyphomicrobiaceae bacterium]
MLRSNYANRQLNRARWQRAAIAPVLGFAVALGGCSADFLRFDSPVFALNGDTTAGDTRVAEAPLADQSPTAAPYDAGSSGSAAGSYAAAPVSGVSRGTPPNIDARSKPTRVASNTPIVAVPKDVSRPSRPVASTPLTTGALRTRDGIVVEPGDTLYQLSRRYGVSVSALRQANGLRGNTIQPGQRLALPGRDADPYGSAPTAQPQRYEPYNDYRQPAPMRRAPLNDYRTAEPSRSSGETYTVRPGDSLYAISRRTGVSVAELKDINGITNVRALRPGMRLSLGKGAAAPAERDSQFASRSYEAPRSQIRSKSIRTMPVVRTKTPPIGGAYQPRILNQRPSRPITTKPRRDVAPAPVAGAGQTFRWPARGRVIASFNHSGQGSKNDGINIALPYGTDIQAAAGGVVAYSGSELKGYGNLVLVRHDNGWVSAYAHASDVLVKRGDRVSRGQVIAKVGRSGGVTQPQLHFELRKGAKPVDPLPHLAAL